MVNPGPRVSRSRAGPSLTGRLSPPVSSLAVRSPPGALRNEADPMRQEQALGELNGAHGGAVARLVGGTPTPATARQGEARTRFARARRCSRARKEGGRGSREEVSTGAELSGELSRALASDSRGREAYHGKATRARGARGGGGAQGKMELALAN